MKDNDTSLLIVGIGASAGGLKVLKGFVRSLPTQTGMAFIIIQHLDPDHKSLLSELLDRESAIPVKDAKDNLPIEADCIYVIPPNAYLEIEGNRLKLVTPTENRGYRKAIDHFFRSLAKAYERRCAGIVLSGSGSDGTAGLKAIKAAGGLALTQPPETADHESMPQSAINAGTVDKIIRVDNMYAVLKQYLEHPLTLQNKEENIPLSSGNNSLEKITAILKTHEEFNLRLYKPSTVQRRIARRMSLTNIKGYEAYLQFLRSNEAERKLLTQDLLISVTGFFRDPEAFEVLEKKVIPNILSHLDDEQPIRVWIAGCATGEEAYSIAILLLEARKKQRNNNPIKIFATDIDEQAIKIARKGVYPGSIAAEVPERLLEKYFSKNENTRHFKINNQVRDLISFAIQNAVLDPPFSHMHLISCRNLLIYLKKEVQEKVIGAFYFALNDEGHLLLGSSETMGSKNKYFKTISKKWKVYQKIPGHNDKHLGIESLYTDRSAKSRYKTALPKISKKGGSRSDLIRQAMLDNILPPGVIVDREGTILYNHGNWSEYLAITTGEPRNEISQLIIPALRTRLRSALYKVRKSKRPLSFRSIISSAEGEKGKKVVRVEITPLLKQDFSEEEIFGVLFYEVPEKHDDQVITQHDEMKVNQNLERELSETKEELQNTVEELETSTEELKAAHEEALSTNEELQSANEELEASAEELRSLNEELNTVNFQLKEKVELLQSANNDLENFFSSTNVPTVFLDPDLQLQRYTPAAGRLMQLSSADIDRPISFLRLPLVDEELLEECNIVLREFRTLRREIQSEDGRWFIRQITPYRAEERRIDGVVLVFHEVTAMKKLSKRAEFREQQQAAVAKLGMMALSGVSPEKLMVQAVRQVAHTLDADFCKVLKYQPEEKKLLLVAGVGWREGLVGEATVSSGPDSQAGFTLMAQEPVIVKRLETEKRFTGPALLTEHQVVSGISCLINHREPPFGVIGVHTKQFREFTEDDANFLLSVANLISTALLNEQTLLRLKESQERLNMARMAAKVGVHDHDLKTNTVKWDTFIRKLWGVPEDLEPITYQIFNDGLHPDDREPTIKAIEEAVHGKNNGELRITYRVINLQDQCMRWVEATGKTIFEQGEAVRMVGTVQDVTDRITTQKQLAESERKLRLAMKSNDLGSFEFSFLEDSAEWNKIINQLWGVKKKEKQNLATFWRNIHPEDIASVRQKFETAIVPGSKGRFHAVFRVIHQRNRSLSWVEASGQTLFKNKRAIKMVGMVMDMTNRKELEHSLRRAVNELKASDQRKNEFLSILGHELRNPLAALQSSIDILEPDSEQSVKIYRIMKRSVATMNKLLNDLLDLSRIAQNKIIIEPQFINLGNLLVNSVSTLKKIHASQERELLVEAGENILVYGDPIRLEQVFNNLLTNSFKFTNRGDKIAVKATLDEDMVRVEIIDEGIGIASSILDMVFQPFFQVKKKGAVPAGLGIGLALSRDLIELHGGTITVHSEGEGQGTTFTVSLPLADDADPSKNKSKGEETLPKVKMGLKVLLIEDNDDIRHMMPLLMEPLKCEVKTAENGENGLRLAESFLPNAMIIDIGLPDIDGHQVAERLRKKGYQGTLIALSGYSHEAIKKQSKAVGFDHHLAKPADLADLAKILSTVQ